MNKKIKWLIFGFIGVVVLVGIMALLIFTAPEDTTEDTEDTTEETITYTLVAENTDNFVSMTVENPDGTFTMVADTVTETIDDVEYTSTTYYIEEFSEFAHDSTWTSSLISTLAAVTASDLVYEVAQDLATFGLDDPQATVTMDFGGDEVVLYLGDYNEGLSVYYAMVEGDEALYTLSTTVANKILCNSYYYLEDQLLPTYDTSTSPYVVLTDLRVQRPDEVDIFLSNDEEYTANASYYTSSMYMVEPILSEMNYDFDESYIPTLFGMVAEDVVAIYNEEEDATTYGFDEPTMVLDLAYIGTDSVAYSEVITVGNVVENADETDTTVYYYVIFSDNGLVYTVSEYYLTLFINLDGDDLITSLPLLPNITTIDSVEMTLDGEVYLFEIENYEEIEVDDDGVETSTLSTVGVSYDGEELDLDSFKTFYQLILSASADAINTEEPEGEPDMIINYNYSDGTVDSLECYISENGRRTQIIVNGEPTYEGRAGYVEKIRIEIVDLFTGGTVDTDW